MIDNEKQPGWLILSSSKVYHTEGEKCNQGDGKKEKTFKGTHLKADALSMISKRKEGRELIISSSRQRLIKQKEVETYYFQTPYIGDYPEKFKGSVSGI